MFKERVMKSILDYSDPNQFLADRWNSIKERNPNMSIRGFARILKLGSHTPIHLMIIGKRRISKNYILILSTYFKLNEAEFKHFLKLVKEVK